MSPHRLAVCLAAMLLFAGAVRAQDAPPSYAKDIQPFLNKYCLSCHKSGNAKAGLILDSYDSVIKAARKGRKLVVAEKPDDSRLVTTTEGTAKPTMPPKTAKTRPTEKEIGLLRAWVAAGAKDDTPARTTAICPTEPAIEIPRSRLAFAECHAIAACCEP
jgi:hypothetical protein